MFIKKVFTAIANLFSRTSTAVETKREEKRKNEEAIKAAQDKRLRKQARNLKGQCNVIPK